MHATTENIGDMYCEIAANRVGEHYTGTLKHRAFEVGDIFGVTQASVYAQFRTICEIVEEGAMVRHGIIMLGYHNRAFCGEVLLLDGVIIGVWTSDDEEWCHFTASCAVGVTCSAPSPWMLHDSIADWLERKKQPGSL